MDEPAGAIHTDHPFATPPEERDPARRFRGRLAAPVTVWTSGPTDGRGALTVSSLVVVEGDPPRLAALISDVTDLWAQVEATDAFVVHVLGWDHRPLAERCALRTPSPGGPFAGLDVRPSPWGPVLADVANRASCRLESATPLGHHRFVVGTVEAFDIDEDFDDPLVYFRGRYRAP